jgi:methylthioribose-1-phosphate isomerase
MHTKFTRIYLCKISIPIEQRPPLEACTVRGSLYPPVLDENGHKKQSVVMITPEGLENIYNPAFDVTSAELITAIVTEKGVAVKKEGEASFDLSGII